MDIKQGQQYRHYKGNSYTIIALAFNSSTCEREVVYQGQYTDPEFGENPVWTRPLSEFTAMVEINGIMVPRFERL